MSVSIAGSSLESIRQFAVPLTGSPGDYAPLLDMIGDASYVLLGEATHGTHEFYKARAEITQQLLTQKGFTVIAWEADWPDALRVHRYVRHVGDDRAAEESLRGFQRFPTWMWRNMDVLDLVEWLREHNATVPKGRPRVGVYGLDLYSLHASMNAVIAYLEEVDPEAAQEARARYSCFEHFGNDPEAYGITASRHRSLSCEKEVVRQLAELHLHAADFLQRDGKIAAEELFYAEQNAVVARNAEKYYRAMYWGRINTWNLRDTHMADTLENLMTHLQQQGERPKAVVWAHNSHVGDARATEMGNQGELNVGQLMRERHPGQCVVVGFTTYTGSVTAASDWGAAPERKRVRPALEESYEVMLHETEPPNFILPIRDRPSLARELKRSHLERAIGVVYRPDTERSSHYFQASLSQQFDAVIHFDETRAVEPLERTTEWESGELPETYPSGF